MTAAYSLLFFSLLFYLLLAHCVESKMCWSSNCTNISCNLLNMKEIKADKCGFMLALKEDCSFIIAMTDSIEKIEEHLKYLNNSTKNLNIVRYSTNESSNSPENIVSNDTAESSKWSLETTNSSGCSDEATNILCILLADPTDDSAPVNKAMCPDPTTTTIFSTTAVQETTKGRTVFTNEAVSAAPAKNETTPSSGTKVGIYVTIIVAMFFNQ